MSVGGASGTGNNPSAGGGSGSGSSGGGGAKNIESAKGAVSNTFAGVLIEAANTYGKGLATGIASGLSKLIVGHPFDTIKGRSASTLSAAVCVRNLMISFVVCCCE